MISDNLQHTYIDKKRKFYAFFQNYEMDIEGDTTYKGFHFFCFDQHGYCWFQAHNATRQFIGAIADGLFLERPAWEADGLHYYESLERDNWIPESPIDVRYALEAVREGLGLDLVLMYQNPEAKTDITKKIKIWKDGNPNAKR